MKYIIANWKMNLNLSQLKDWLSEFSKISEGKSFRNKIILAPTYSHLNLVSEFANLKSLAISAQDVSVYDRGAHTGEVGAFDLKDYAQYCIVGHSERKENRAEVLVKAQQCLKHGVTPIICFINPQDLSQNLLPGALVAWEDPKNISKNGTYQNQPTNQIQEIFKSMKSQNKDIPIIYGGSVNRENVYNLAKIPEIDGALVGNASLEPQHLLEIVLAFE